MALGDLRHPVVQRCINETRKVVNNIIRTYGKPDYIRIEMARDVKLVGKKKAAALKINKTRQRMREKAKKWLRESDIPVNEWSLLKYQLWEETGHRDIYSGDTISCDDLFRKGIYQVEHIMPRHRSRDDTFNNLLLCRNDLNQVKGNRTPLKLLARRNNGQVCLTVWKKQKFQKTNRNGSGEKNIMMNLVMPD